MRLDKFLCDLQLGTRSQVKEYIKKGNITVNDVIIKKPDYKINESSDTIMYRGEVLTYQSLYYYMLHKPAGVVTATRDNHDSTVMDLLAGAFGRDLFPVGRLDKDTEGLLLITNDGELAHNLLSPRKHVSKTYYAECTGIINTDKLTRLEQGLDIGDTEITLPAKAELISQSDAAYAIRLTIVEGRFHQVKRMIAAIGGSVTYLKRISMGSLVLDEKLPKGKYRSLTENEIIGLKSHALNEEV